MDHVAQYRTNGYAVVRGVFSPDEIARIAAAIDAVHAEGVAHGRAFRHGNLFYNVRTDADGAPVVPMVQWPSYHNDVLNAVRLDPRWVELLAPLIGGDLKQIINQLHWKAPGSLGDFAWHQDSRFRKPDEAYRNLGSSYIQTGLAIDPHTRASGAMRMIPNSHRAGPLDLDTSTEVLGNEMTDDALRSAGIDPADVIDLEMEPGDIAMWSPYLVHGSGRNSADHQRRFYINGYVRAADCDRGEWAFRDGQPVPLGPEPVLVHYDALHENPEPHYV
jgi:ectoine hydroxylase-related dioxygenase (phytanoyl-CoA dioxygenase family)